MEKQTKKEILFFTVIFFGILLIGILGGLLLSLLGNTVELGEAPSFAGLQNDIGMYFKDSLFRKALSNTMLLSLFPILSAALIGYILSIRLHKLPRMVIYIVFGFVMVSAIGSWIVYRVITASGGYDKLNRMLTWLGIIKQPFGLEESSLSILTLLFGILAFLAALGICVLFFTASVFHSWNGIKKIGIILTGMVVAVFCSTAICGAATQLIGYPAVDYSVHTIVGHWNDYGRTQSHLSALSIAGITLKSELAVLLTFGLWGMDKLRIFLKNKLF